MRRGVFLAAAAGTVLLVASCAGEGSDRNADAAEEVSTSGDAGTDVSQFPPGLQEVLSEYEVVAAVGDTITLDSSLGQHDLTLSNPRELDPPETMVDDYDLFEDDEWYFSVDAELLQNESDPDAIPLTFSDFLTFEIKNIEDGAAKPAGNRSTTFFDGLAGPDLDTEPSDGEVLRATLTFGVYGDVENPFLVLANEAPDGRSEYALVLEVADIGEAVEADTAAAAKEDLAPVESVDEVTIEQDDLVEFGEPYTVVEMGGSYTYTIEQPRRIEVPEEDYPQGAEDDWFPVAFEVTIEASDVPEGAAKPYTSLRGRLSLQEPFDKERLGPEYGNGSRVGYTLRSDQFDDVSPTELLPNGEAMTSDLIMLVEEREVYELQGGEDFSILFLHDDIQPLD